MELHKIQTTNFLSYQEQEFSFEGAGLSLIEGRNHDEGDSNGSGKSSLFDAVSFCLFGQTVRGLKGDDVINRKFKRDTLVGLTLTSFGTRYRVVRCRKHKEHGDRLWVEGHGGITELGTLAQTQQWILDTFQIDFDLFRCTVLFAQGETFNFVDAGNKAQKEILSKVMKISYDNYLVLAKSKVNECKALVDSHEMMVARLEGKVVDDVETAFKARIEDWEADRRSHIADSEGDINTAETHLEGLRAKAKPLGQIKKLITRLTFDLRIKKDALKDLRTELAEILGRVSYYTVEIKKAKALDGDCPTCRSKIDICLNGEWIKDSENKKAVEEGLAADKNAECEKLDAEIDDAEEKLVKLRKVENDQKHIDSSICIHEDRIIQCEKDIAFWKGKANPYLADMEAVKVEQGTLKTEIEERKTKTSQYRALLPYYEFWTSAFGDSGIKSFIFDLVCSNLTNKANRYLNLLSGGAISISFDTQKKTKGGELREKFDCVVQSDGQHVDYASYSGGEKRRISLAVDMALSDIMAEYHGSKFNVVVFDEQDSYLDTNGRKQYLHLLKTLGKEKRVFVVAHDNEFKGYFDSVITVEKKGGISRIVV
jgi:DNA repair exonuclease SbcCD ATPase subunit